MFLGQLSHPNLVKLIGYCCEDEQRVLIYEYMARGSVENNLFSSKHFLLLLTSLFMHFSFSMLFSERLVLGQSHCRILVSILRCWFNTC